MSSETKLLPSPESKQIPTSCWGLLKLCLKLMGDNIVLEAKVHSLETELKSLQKVQEAVDRARSTFMEAAQAHTNLVRSLQDATAVELGKDYQLHWHRKSTDKED